MVVDIRQVCPPGPVTALPRGVRLVFRVCFFDMCDIVYSVSHVVDPGQQAVVTHCIMHEYWACRYHAAFNDTQAYERTACFPVSLMHKLQQPAAIYRSILQLRIPTNTRAINKCGTFASDALADPSLAMMRMMDEDEPGRSTEQQ